MNRLLLLAGAAALVLSGCVSHNFREGQRTEFRCDAGKAFSVRRLPPSIEVYAAGQTYRLEPDGENLFRSGDSAVTYAQSDRSARQARLDGVHGGPFVGCRPRVRPLL